MLQSLSPGTNIAMETNQLLQGVKKLWSSFRIHQHWNPQPPDRNADSRTPPRNPHTQWLCGL
eukprot:4276879-Amphidinium_carterae.1